MFNEDKVRLHHMLDAAQKALAFVANHSRQDLNSNEQLSLALVRLLEVIGEAAKAVSVETCKQHPEIPWTVMAGMRNRLIHGYFDVDLDIVWQTVKNDLPPLVKTLEKIIETV